MAYLEHNWRLSEAQQVTADAASTNVVDLEDVRDLGEGTPVYAHFQVVNGDITGEGNIRIQVVTSDSSTLASGRFLLAESPALTQTELTENSQFFLPIGFFRRGEDNTIYAFDGTPTSTANGLRYIGAYYDVTDTVGGSGRITARLTLDTSTTPRIYPASTNT